MSAFRLAGAIALLAAVPVQASVQVATVTQTEGTVKLLTSPTTQGFEGPPPHARFEGINYSEREVRVGDRVEQGNILRTSPGSKARVVYDNGDQLSVGSATAYKIRWKQDSATSQVSMDLMYGRVRGVVEKGGPRSHFLIRTKSATMGVRGTDFFIATGGAAAEATEVTILRGAVEVTPLAQAASAAAPKPVVVKAGESAEVARPAPVPVGAVLSATEDEDASTPAPGVEVRSTTQQELSAIRSASHVAAPAAPAPAPVQALEQKAVATTMKDIQAADPALFAALQAKPAPASSEELNSAVVSKAAETAPAAPPNHKPSAVELDDAGQGVYDRFYKNGE
jgi:hypothetical protein